jgi:hypothetical protein
MDKQEDLVISIYNLKILMIYRVYLSMEDPLYSYF